MISRLKSLELQGYKTFANRTVFEFPGAVTAIVGPNGSGKSNITDALRWVLGEQSYSLLRGKKTEDMIFAGSERRTRSGMATATVILDNSDNWLPIDYSEVAIQRRAYRDGSNEYLLNGQRVRLKDVSELLAESGLAERTYTIIGQGLVDAALALRAEDRRRLFEEAAGIGLHRTRRQEALRRLDDTQRNLERVEDILSELRPRVRSLERQARRAQEYDQAVGELRELLREWYGYHWHRAQEELSAAKALASEQSDALEEIRQRELDLTAEIDQLREKRAAIREKLNEFDRRSSELHAERENTSRNLAVAEERSRNFQEQELKLKSDLSLSIEELSLLEERNHFLDEEVNRLQTEFEEAKQRYASVKASFATRQEERSSLEANLSENQQLLLHHSTRKVQLISQRTENLIQLQNLEKSLEKAVNALDKVKAGLEKSEIRAKELDRQLEEATSNLSEIENSLQNYSQYISRKSNQMLDYSKLLAKSEADVSKINAQIEVLQQAESSYSGYSEGAKLLLSAVKELKISANHGILGTRIEVEQDYELAVGAALGDYVDALILDDSTEIQKALNLLEQAEEKGALLPLRKLQPWKSVLKYSKEKGVIGRADQFVEVPEELKSAVETLLGNTLVVEDRQTAENILEMLSKDSTNGDKDSVKIVTRRGEVFYGIGPIKTSKKQSPVILGRPRELKNLISKLEGSQAEVSEKQDQMASLEKELQDLKTQEGKLMAQLNRQIEVKEKVASAHSQELLGLRQAGNEVRWWEAQVNELKESISQFHGKIETTRVDLDRLEEQEEQVQKDVDRQQKRLNELPIENLQSDLTHWSTRLEILKQARAESTHRQTERIQLLQAAISKQEALKDVLAELITSQTELSDEILQLNQTNEDIAAKLEEIQQSIVPAESNLETVESKLSNLTQLGLKERAQTSQSEQSFTQARIEQIRKQEALDSLRRQIESDFGLVDFEYREDVSGPSPLPLDGFVEDLPLRKVLSPELEESLKRQRSLLRRIGPINPEAQIEYRDVFERQEFLSSQMHDLQEASEDVKRVIAELDEIMQIEFCNTFEAVAEEFHKIFGRLFGGGSARLILTDPNDLTNTGIDIEARLPGRREQGLSLLSGGERSLTAVALVFSLLRVSPTPFCVLDEVDAMLDEANVGRFRGLLRELSETTQFIMITHNRATVQVADVIYGVTMGRDSTSQILSLKVDELEKVIN
ncbi:MAG: chromosome segregation protein SMC [Anaerolineales bacterium]